MIFTKFSLLISRQVLLFNIYTFSAKIHLLNRSYLQSMIHPVLSSSLKSLSTLRIQIFRIESFSGASEWPQHAAHSSLRIPESVTFVPLSIVEGCPGKGQRLSGPRSHSPAAVRDFSSHASLSRVPISLHASQCDSHRSVDLSLASKRQRSVGLSSDSNGCEVKAFGY